MGSKNCPETPRQKLIGMMYLVLTALLALNVSKEILQAFVTVNSSVEATNENFGKKIESSYATFKNANTINPDKVGPYWNKAQKVREYSKGMIEYLKTTQYDLIAFTEGVTSAEAKKIKLADIKRKDNFNDPTAYFIAGSQNGEKGKGVEVKNKIDEYKKNLLSLVDPSVKSVFAKTLGLNTDIGGKNSTGKMLNWQMYNFYQTIIAADITILNKLINEVQNAEFDIISYLMKDINANDFTFDKVGAKVVAKSNYILVGEQYEAEIFVAAYDTKSSISADINGTKVMGDSGLVSYKVGAGAPGLKTYKGFINVKSPTGEKLYPFESEYIVAPPSMSVAPSKMNVFYMGVENPVTISAAGVADKDLRPSISIGTIKRSKEGWIVNVPASSGKTIITVNAEMNGKVKRMGVAEFRMKRVPDPVAYIANKNDGVVDRNVLSSAGALIPRLDGFDFDLNFVITSFIFSNLANTGIIEEPVKGNKLNDKCKLMIKNAKRGSKVYFENITAKGPDGTNRKLANITLRIQ